MTGPRRPNFGLIAGYLLLILVLCAAAPQHPIVSGVAGGVLANLLAAELDRDGGAYARWLIRQAARLLPLEERARWTDEWLDHIEAAGEHGMRPVMTAWTIALLAAPRMAWETRRRDSSTSDEFAALLLSDLFAVLDEHRGDTPEPLERSLIERAFAFACEFHADQRRPSGEDFIVHPVAVAKICAGLRLDTSTLCAALLHETVGEARVPAERLNDRFGGEVAGLVEAVAQLTRERPRHHKELLPATRDMRATMLVLADRLHDMRTLHALPRSTQRDVAQETLSVHAPLADRLGIHAMKWELEDLSLATLDPRKYKQIKHLVNARREERERYTARVATHLQIELEARAGIDASVSGRAKHFYSILSKMDDTGCAFDDIEDLTAVRVLVDTTSEQYVAIDVIHAMWEPCPGRLRDYVASPKPNLYEALHTTVVGPEAQRLRIQIRTREMHEIAEYGVAIPAAGRRIAFDRP